MAEAGFLLDPRPRLDFTAGLTLRRSLKPQSGLLDCQSQGLDDTAFKAIGDLDIQGVSPDDGRGRPELL